MFWRSFACSSQLLFLFVCAKILHLTYQSAFAIQLLHVRLGSTALLPASNVEGLGSVTG